MTPGDHSHEGVASLTLAEHHHPAEAKKVVLALNTGSGYAEASGTALGELNVNASFSGSVTIAAEYPEDSAHVSGDIGSFVLGVSNAGGAPLVDNDLDYCAIATNSAGFVQTEVQNLVQVDVTTPVELQAQISGDTADTIAYPGVAMIGFRNDAAATTTASADGNSSHVSTDDKGRLMVTGTATMTALKVDGSAVTQPVSGTVTVTEPVSVDDNGASLTVDTPQLPPALGGTGGLIVEGTGPSGSVKVQEIFNSVDAGTFSIGLGAVWPVAFVVDETATNDPTENEAAAARIDTKRAQICVIEDATTRGRKAVVTAAGNLSVVGAAPLNVTGSGTQAAALRITTATDSPDVVSLAIIDDWDETDRCKVNPIVGQAGVAANSGNVSATTQRVVLAADVTLPAAPQDKVEDAAHSSGATGAFVLGVRNDLAAATLTSTDGDYSPVATDSRGCPIVVMHVGNAVITETFTASPTTGTTLDITHYPCKHWSLQVTGTGAAATTWTVNAYGSNDNANFSTVFMQHTNATGNGVVTNPLNIIGGGQIALPFRYVQLRAVSTLTLGSATNIVATLLGMP